MPILFLSNQLASVLLTTGYIDVKHQLGTQLPKAKNYCYQVVMVTYEVNLLINNSVLSKFESWLDEHVNQMLQLPGFLGAQIFSQEDYSGDGQLTPKVVLYQVENLELLQNYFSLHAAKMREQGLERFSDNFTAKRRVLCTQKSWQRQTFSDR